MFGSVLVANRGEIACRIIRTARRLGMRAIAVYSEADAGAPHVRQADEAVLIGRAPARESYLDPERILNAAFETGAEAVHPGYGFLSENAAFAEAVAAAGPVWIGPPAAAIRAMGRKDAAKRLMAEAGVPTTPGYLGEDQDPARLQAEAGRIGYPVLLKPVAGGGGKGMRAVTAAEDFPAALAASRREALASFGDDRVLIETYLARARHIEVQVFADRHGQVVHLFERDCSLQRRHQKLIEEAPAPGMDEAVRQTVCEAAVRAARAVGYEGAGTVEFIADAVDGLRADRIWFMEMNTRLQVEHPVTEAVTGHDLVEWQFRVAAGEPLPLAQEALRLDGWAIEARLYAENPAAGFLPSVGPLTRLHLPAGLVRVDSGVEEGGEVGPFYDPLLAKLIAHAPTRKAAAARLAQACRAVEAWPVKTNAAFLARTLDDPDFIAGSVETGFVETRLARLAYDPGPSSAAFTAAAAARLAQAAPADDPWSGLAGFRLNAPPRLEVGVQIGERAERIRLDGQGPPRLPTRSVDGTILVFEAGEAYAFTEPRPKALEAGEAGGDDAIVSPMPGRVVLVGPKAGDRVARGEALVTVEAMKMEHTLSAPFDGVVASRSVELGDQVTEGEVLMRLSREA